jgi:hypothetical protein
MARRTFRPQLTRNLLVQVVIEGLPVGQLHEHGHIKIAAGELDANHKAVGDFGQIVDDPVYFGGADANPKPVEGRVRSSVDITATTLIDFEEVAVAPYARDIVKIGRFVSDIVIVV